MLNHCHFQTQFLRISRQVSDLEIIIVFLNIELKVQIAPAHVDVSSDILFLGMSVPLGVLLW